ncbi:MAG: hypothetical protein JNL54_19355 [Kineosporiaceae bacterium]|nr:hypothetical protein [Kineosporiaceae bacterium]
MTHISPHLTQALTVSLLHDRLAETDRRRLARLARDAAATRSRRGPRWPGRARWQARRGRRGLTVPA